MLCPLQIRDKIMQALRPRLCLMENESALHQGHGESPNTETSHLSFLIVDDSFEGVSLVERHRKIYNLLKEELKSEIHALKLNLYTLDEALGKGLLL